MFLGFRGIRLPSPPFTTSEADLRRKLDLARIELAEDAAKVRLIDNPADQVEVRMIRQIEEFRAKLRADALRNVELSRDREIEVRQPWPDHSVPAQRAELERGRSHKRRRVE